MPAAGTGIIILKKNTDRHVSTMPDEGVAALYKRCGFKKPDGFRVHCTWMLPGESSTIFVRVFGKTEGRAGSENKSELPPPVDTTLFFGNIAIVAYIGTDIETARPTPLSIERLDGLFELLVGGVEDLGVAAADKADAAEDQEADEEDEDALLPRTREGYAKDGFVVDDEDVEDSDDEEDGTSEDESTESDDEEGDDSVSVSHEEPASDAMIASMEVEENAVFRSDGTRNELVPEDYDSE